MKDYEDTSQSKGGRKGNESKSFGESIVDECEARGKRNLNKSKIMKEYKKSTRTGRGSFQKQSSMRGELV